MKNTKIRGYKERLKGHKHSVISIFSPDENSNVIYSFSRDGQLRGNSLLTSLGPARKKTALKSEFDKKSGFYKRTKI